MDQQTKDPVILIPWIGKTAKFMDYYIMDYMKEKGVDLSKQQFIVLKYLHEQDGRIQNDLAFITDRSKTALTRLIQTMEKKGLVYRETSSKDMRINHVYLTEEGRKTWNESLPHFLDIVRELQNGVSEDDLLKVQSTLEQIQKNIFKRININH